MIPLLIKGGRVVDPSRNTETYASVSFMPSSRAVELAWFAKPARCSAA